MAASSPIANVTTRYLSLDMWRGIAAMWVLLCHAALNGSVLDLNREYHSLLFLFAEVGSLGVQIFFVVSGYCIAAAAARAHLLQDGLKKYACDRVRRIYPPYLAACALTVGAWGIMLFLKSRGLVESSVIASADFGNRSPLYYIANLTLTQMLLHQEFICMIFWTLCYEVAFYVIVGCMLFLRRKFACPAFSTGAMDALAWGALVWLILSPGTCPYPLDRWPQFAIGAGVFAILREPGRKSLVFRLGVTSALFSIFAFSHSLGGHNRGEVNSSVQSLACVAFAWTLLMLKPFDLKLSRALVVRAVTHVGLFSYSLYLSHLLAIGFAGLLIRKFHLSTAPDWSLLLVQFAVGLVGGWCFYLFFERTWLRGGRKPSVDHGSRAINAAE